MNRIFFILFAFLIAPALKGQTGIDSLMLKLEQAQKPDTKRVDILNQLGYEYWIIDSKKSIEYGSEALNLADTLNYLAGIAKAERIIGVSYWTLGQPKLALENLTAAHNTYKEINDEEGVANCLLNMGMVYAAIEDHDKALDLYDKAIEKFSKHNLKSRIATTYTKIGMVLMEKDQLYDAKEYFTNALNIHSENNFTYGSAEAHNKLGTLFLIEGELEQADYHLRKAVTMSKSINDEDGLISNLVQFGKLLRLRNEYEAADIHLNLAVKKAAEKQLKRYILDAYYELRLLKKQQGKLEESLEYYDAYTALKDSIYNTQKSKQIATLEFSNEMAEKNKEMEFLYQQREKDQLIQWIFVSTLLIIILLSVFLIRSLHLKNKNQQELIKSKDLIAKTELENQRLQHAELTQQLHFKNKELTSYALNFVQKKELLEAIYEKIKSAQNESGGKQIKALNDLEKIIRQHKNVEKDWEDFKVHFEQVHTSFLKNLKSTFPELSGNDLKVAALTRLNLSTKESSGILGISPESTKTARYRLRKKLGLDQDEDLLSFFTQFERKNQH